MFRKYLAWMRDNTRRVLGSSVHVQPFELEACWLEDRLLYSATTLPIELVEGQAEGSPYQISEADVNEILRCINTELDVLSPASAEQSPLQDSHVDASQGELSNYDATAGGLSECPSTDSPSTSRLDNALVDSSLSNLESLVRELQAVGDDDHTTLEVVLLDHRTSGIDDADILIRACQPASVDQPLLAVEDGVDVVLVDSQLQDSLTLEQAVRSGAHLIAYDGSTDTAHDVLQRVTEWVATRGELIKSLSILSHGAAGGFELGRDWITDSSLILDPSDWLHVARYMTQDANIYVFGCNVASTAEGQELLDDLASLTSTNVYASNNISGVGGDWILEARSNGSPSYDASGMVVPLDVELLEASDASLAWYNASWNYRKQITIDHTKVSATQSNFSVLVNLASDVNLQAYALANGNDLVFTAADGTTKLDYEIEKYSSINGQLVAWIRLPTLSAATDTVVYLYYGNASATNQQNATGAYDTSTVAVYHLSESAGSYIDSTTTPNNSTSGTNPTQSSGEIGSGQTFNGSSQFIGIPNQASLDITNNATVSAWIKLNSTGQADIVEKGGSGGYALKFDGTKVAFGAQAAASGGWAYSTTNLVTGVWYKIDGVDNAGTKTIYVNGVLEGSSSSTSSFANTNTLQIGKGSDGFFGGVIDEVNIDNVARSAAWIATEYNNQSSPNTFYSLSTQVDYNKVTVTTTVDIDDSGLGTAYTIQQLNAANGGSDGKISLREAIIAANNTAGTDTISFYITGTTGFVGTAGVDGRYVINLASALGALTQSVIIDGTTQTANQGDSNVGMLGTGGTVGTDAQTLAQVNRPEIEIVGTSSIANAFDINANNVTIRGLALRKFSSEAILVRDATTGTMIEKNIIGFGATAYADPGAGSRMGHNIRSLGGDNVTVQNNVFGYADQTGINLSNSSNNWTIQANEFVNIGIGFNNADGIAVAASSGTTITGNRITGASTQAVILSSGATTATIQNNTMLGNGVGPTGGAVVQNDTIAARSGVTNSTIYRNIIADNYGSAVTIDNGASGITISENSIYGNGLITSRNGSAASGLVGIDLQNPTDNTQLGTAPYYTLNDVGDGDSGGNSLQNFPVITSAISTGTQITLAGSINSVSNRTYKIEFFSSSSYANGYGQGAKFLGSATVTTDGLGNGTFSTTLSAIVNSSSYVTATATDLTTNETSEFGAQFAVNGPALANDDNGYFDFDGTDDFISIAGSASLTLTTSATIEAWVNRIASSNATQIIINKEGEYEVALSNTGNVMWAFANSNPGWSWHDTGYSIGVSTWSHVAVSYNNGVVSTYVNGNLVDVYNGAGSIGDQYPTFNELRIGGRSSNPTSQYFSGSIDDVRIWNVARTQAQIISSMASTLTGSETGLAAYYKFDSSGTVLDATANHNDGIVGAGVANQQPAFVQYATTENASLVITAASGLLNNDIDADGDTLSVTAINGNIAGIGNTVTISSGAQVTLSANGSFTYNPGTAFDYLPAGQVATDTFVYTVSDGQGNTDTASVSVRITGANDAPTLSGANNFTAINEEATTNGGNLVSALLSGKLSDPDVNAVSGIAITSLNSSNGAWQYSLDGGTTWSAVGAVSSSSALLLSSSDRLRFVPDGLNADAGSVTFCAWDQTTGSRGTFSDTSNNGGTTAFSSTLATASITVTAVNDAPTIVNGYTYSLPTTNENSTSAATLASSILSSSTWADVDTGALKGLAITAKTGNGTWQYSTDGTTWNSFGSVSSTSALLISSTTQVRYVPDNSNGETASFSYRAWDQTSGSSSTNATASYGSTASNGGSAAFSTSVATAVMSVTSVNDAPVLSPYSPTMPLTEDSGPFTASVATLLSTNVSDVDTGALRGVAITSVSGSGGTFSYSTDGGITWTNFANPSTSSALLLRSSDLVRVTMNGANGGVATMSYRAWDQTSGTFGNSVDASTGGGTTAFSTAFDTVTVSVTSINDAPTIASGYTHSFASTNENTASAATLVSTILSGSSWSDVDTGAVSGLAITGKTGSGTWQYSVDGTTWTNFGTVSSANALLISSSTQVRYVPDNNNGETATFTYKAWDQTSGTASTVSTPNYASTTTSGGTSSYSSNTDTAQIVVAAVNDSPTLSGSNNFTTISEKATSNSGDLVSTLISGKLGDVDAGAMSGVAVTALNSGQGIWQYSIDGGTTWNSIGTVSGPSALLLASTDRLRFVPDGLNADAGNLTFRGWDQSAGLHGTKVDTSINGGTTAFSTAVATASILVTAVNDAPIAVGDTAFAIESGGVLNGTAGLNPTGNVLTNDTDVDSSDTKTVTGVLAGTQANATSNVASSVTGTYGSISIAANGSYTYIVDNSNSTVQALRASGQSVSDIFTYTMRDTAGLTSTTQITVTIQGANDSPYDLSAGALAVNENSTNLTVLGSVVGWDVDSSGNGEVLTYSLTDDANGRFAINGSTGQIMVADGSLLDREVSASHSITVRVSDASGATFDKSFTIAVIDVNEFNASTPLDLNTTANSLAENAANGSLVGITAYTVDADATTSAITYSLDNSAGGRFAIDITTGVVTVADGSLLNYEAATSHSITVRATSADGSSATQTYTIALSDVNESPISTMSDANGISNFSLENAVAGSTVGITALATDDDGTDAVSYSLDDSAGGRFAIDPTTGIVTVAGTIDREVAGNYDITVRATSTDGSSTTRIFSITIGDVDEFNVGTVADTNPSTNAVSENAAVGTTVGITATASDADATTNAIFYSLFDSDGGRFAIDSTTGVVTVAGAIDRESDGPVRSIIVRATSADGSFTDQNFNINIYDVDEFNVGTVTDTNATANAVSENATIGTTVGITAAANDVDATNNVVIYSLFDNDGGRFAIDSTTGVVTVAGAIDRENDGPVRSITVRATSADGSFTDQNFSININDVDEFNVGTVTDSNATANSVNENAIIGTTVGITASASDSDATNNAITYSLLDNDGGRFAIDSTTGVVTVAGAIDRENDGPVRSITVRATSADGSFTDQNFSIDINDVDEFNVGAVTETDATANAVNENATVGTTVGITAAASDADATNNTIIYSLFDNDGGRFAIDSTTGVVTVAGAIDRESGGPVRSIIVRGTSADGSFTDQNFNININDVDEFNVGTVTDTNATANAVSENATIGTTVGITAAANDADATTNAITYSLFDNDGGRFAIDSTTGVVTVAGAIDRESDGPVRSITVRATSADGSFTDQNFSININDVDEFNVGAVTDTNATANAVTENATIGTTVGITAAASDADATNNAIFYSLFDNDGGRFAIDSTTGVVTVAGAIDRENDGPLRSIIVRATSADGSFTDQNFSIDINDVDEFNVGTVTDTNANSNAVSENATIGTTVGITAAASDADATTNAIAYSLFDNDGGRFAIDSTTGVVTVAGAIDRESDGPVRSITVRATSTDGSFTDQNFSININDVDEFNVGTVTDTNATTNAVSENATIGTTVGITAAASDSDATTNAITYLLFDNDGGRFAIDSITGVVTVAGAIDRENDGPVRSITVRATSADGSFTDQNFLININDVDEFNAGAVTDTNATANAVSENATIGTTVGITAAASDADATTNAIVYSLFDSDGGRFTIDSTTGVVTVAGAIDRESDGPVRSIIVRATSADGSFTDQNFSININDIDEFDVGTVADTNAIVNAVSENATIGTTVGITAAASDSDATTNAIIYSLFDSDGGRFAIDSTTGAVTVAGAIDRENDGPVRSIIVRATSADGSFTDQNFSINIDDVDEFNVGAVTDTNATANAVSENATVGTTVGITAAASDADATTNAIFYSLFDNDGGRFAIDSTTGVVTVAGAIDRENDGPVRSITVRATSADGSFTDQNFSININDVDEFNVGAVTDTNATANAVSENATIGTTVGIAAAANDADATTNAIFYSLSDSDGGRFTIHSTTGVVTVAGAIDRENDGPVRSIIVRATSADGSFTDQSFSININDVDEFNVGAVTDTNAITNAVSENATIGTTVGITAAASDADATTNAIAYSLFDNDGGRFAIDSTTGVVTVAGAIDRENDGPVRSITVRATSADGSFTDQNFSININDVDEFNVGPASDTNATTNAVNENAAFGTTVGITAAASDLDATTNAITYSLFENDGGRFAIDSTTGVVTVAGAIDRESDGPVRSIIVRATSADGSFADQNFSININDVDEFNVGAVTDTNAITNAVSENATIGTTVGITAAASDADATTNAIIYSLFDSDGGRFAIDSATGVVTVAGAIDRENDGPVRSITVRATSADGSFTDQNFSININDVDEFNVGPASDTNATANAVNENAAFGTTVGITAVARDADATTNAIVYTLDDSAGGRFAIQAVTGVITVADGSRLDYEAAASHTIIVRATSADGSSSCQAMVIAVVDVNEAPTAIGRSFTVNNVQVLNVDRNVLTSRMSDPDGNPLSVQLAGGPSHGVLVLNSDGSFQYSANPGFVGEDSFTIRSFDGQLCSSAATVTIIVTLPPVNPSSGSTAGSSASNGSSTGSPSSSSTSSSSTNNTGATPTQTTTDGMPIGHDNSKIAERSMESQQSAERGTTESNGTAALEQLAVSSQSSQQVGSMQLGNFSWSPLTVSAAEMRASETGESVRLLTRRVGDNPMIEPQNVSQADSVERQDFSSFAEPAKWTVISTGVVIWAVRLGHIITTFASTASAWVYIDPLTVFPSGKDKTCPEDNISEAMFDADRKKNCPTPL